MPTFKLEFVSDANNVLPEIFASPSTEKVSSSGVTSGSIFTETLLFIESTNKVEPNAESDKKNKSELTVKVPSI